MHSVAGEGFAIEGEKRQILMAQFRCPYCFKPLPRDLREDRTKTVFWFGAHGKRYAHTQCWIDDEIALCPPLRSEPSPELKFVALPGG